MSFEDIDTPVSESELSGNDAETEQEIVEESVAEPVAEEVAVEESQATKGEVEDAPQERAPIIPRARFDEVNAKLHAEREEASRLREEIESLRKQQQGSQQSIDVETLEQQHFDAIMEGDKELAVSIRAQINAELESRAEARATERFEKQIGEREQQSALMNAVAVAVERYPFLDSNSADANTQAINDVIEWRDFFISRGESAHVALVKAADKVGPMYAVAPQPNEIKQDVRKQEAIARNVKDANAQPPSPSAGVGNRAAPPVPKIDTQSDWESLSEKERERLLMEG